MLAVAGMQRSDSDPHDTTSMPIEVGPYWRIMWPFRSEDHRTTERAQADRSRHPVGRFGIHPFAHYGAPIRRKILYAGCPRAECGAAVPIQISSVIQQRGDSRRDRYSFSTDEASLFKQNLLKSVHR
jgi:hypothetical protein